MTDDTRALLRFALGGMVLVRGQLLAAIRAAPLASADTASEVVPSARHLVIGALFEAPALLARLGRTRPVRLARRLGRRFEAPLARRAAAWRARGAAEEAMVVAVARGAIDRLVDGAVDEVAASPSLETLVQAQGHSFEQDALLRMRDKTAEADARVEHLFRRVRRR